jgi:hypothetical protein
MYGPPYRKDGPGKPWGANEALLRGLPSNFDWADGAAPRNWAPDYYPAVTPWGQIFEAGEKGSPVRDVSVEVKSLEVFWLIDGKWQKVAPPTGSDGSVQGGYYSGRFTDAESFIGTDHSDGVSRFSLSPIHDLSHPVAHFWWAGWYPRPYVPAGTTAMHISVWMRLVPNKPGIDLSKARYVAGVGIDEYKASTGASDGPNGSLGLPRHRMLSSSWERYGFTNLSAAQIMQDPPPVTEQ